MDFEERGPRPLRSGHRLDEPARLSLGMVASLQSPASVSPSIAIVTSCLMLLVAAGAVVAGGGPPPVCGPVRRGSPSSVRRAYRLALQAGRAMEPHGIVVVHVPSNQTPCILWRQRCSRPDALSFERFVPALDLSRSIEDRFCLRVKFLATDSEIPRARQVDRLSWERG